MSERKFRGKKHEERVSAALDKGRALAGANVGKALYIKAVDGDITAIRWWKTTRAGRSERQNNQVLGMHQPGIGEAEWWYLGRADRKHLYW